MSYLYSCEQIQDGEGTSVTSVLVQEIQGEPEISPSSLLKSTNSAYEISDADTDWSDMAAFENEDDLNFSDTDEDDIEARWFPSLLQESFIQPLDDSDDEEALDSSVLVESAVIVSSADVAEIIESEYSDDGDGGLSTGKSGSPKSSDRRKSRKLWRDKPEQEKQIAQQQSLVPIERHKIISAVLSPFFFKDNNNNKRFGIKSVSILKVVFSYDAFYYNNIGSVLFCNPTRLHASRSLSGQLLSQRMKIGLIFVSFESHKTKFDPPNRLQKKMEDKGRSWTAQNNIREVTRRSSGCGCNGAGRTSRLDQFPRTFRILSDREEMVETCTGTKGWWGLDRKKKPLEGELGNHGDDREWYKKSLDVRGVEIQGIYENQAVGSVKKVPTISNDSEPEEGDGGRVNSYGHELEIT
ncbi:hypothetical protein PHYBLDRAFT_148127 [Phycomyces blakesleeanus NRRL 1555(-)]|uniref:Uncharacterized protein n=1 Tax=Phycomyces blakesleeanus (strain ATCC 8743b / DSM 1359 / FGSC 10004 / NBRC 33097 / NRRL 1555) TaxID=763407 RepID=A0A162TYS4_PHYB8|nr:hypothetical protein PHYBLDRAFT_148127 [Phycomyces blakesleeanus NRRL 1555(-)]OAD70903.1 hypothetical protein PHYBLDRAFT_148127 [Phycomyces blakesleeanus NRRL 1555(-)]|eukprot:XP_018288943.1 hypothetical protein PHYBLDRAFT_148127 [Phycomyces blakesleeanus NRRL 1555(-)]